MTSLDKNVKAVKKILTSQDILVFEFVSDGGKKFAAIYADGICNKQLLGELVVKPLRAVKKDDAIEKVRLMLASPEVKDGDKIADAVKEIQDGNAVLFIDGEKDFFILGLKSPPARAVAEPPTQIAVKGPREGFIEEIKTNMGLVRKRIKSPNLQIKTLKSGKQSETTVALVYIEGVCPKGLPEKIEKEISENKIDPTETALVAWAFGEKGEGGKRGPTFPRSFPIVRAPFSNAAALRKNPIYSAQKCRKAGWGYLLTVRP